MKSTIRILIALAATLASLALVACGSDDEGDTGAPEADTLEPSQAENAKGEVTWCIGKDTTGSFQAGIDAFNKDNPDVKAQLLELPTSADQQRAQLVQRLQAESDECDVVGMDVIWTAEFASSGWLYDLTPVLDEEQSRFIASTVESTEYGGKDWALPFNTNAGFLYYRTDQVSKPPTSWQDVYSEAQKTNGVIYQGARYEGLTVNFLELLYADGGTVLSDDGTEVEIDSPETTEVLEFMDKGIADGAVPKDVSTYMEEESRTAFEAGKATFMRNWPYAYALGKESDIANDFDITLLPGFAGGEGAGVLGGYNLGISSYTDNPEASLALAEFLTEPEFQTQMMTDASLPATVSESYDDPAVQKAQPFALDLRKAVEQAQPRPVSPVYPQISEAIYKNVYDVINGDTSPDEAASNMQSEIDKALQTF